MAWVHERIFAGGGELIPATWDQFSREMNIQAVIHLSKPAPMSFIGRLPNRFLWLDVDKETETDFQARALCGRFVHEALLDGHGVLIHSAHGRHRTRWIYVSYQLYIGRQLRAALRLSEEKPWQAPYHTSRSQWAEFEAFLRDNR